jgi:hypothetical protein
LWGIKIEGSAIDTVISEVFCGDRNDYYVENKRKLIARYRSYESESLYDLKTKNLCSILPSSCRDHVFPSFAMTMHLFPSGRGRTSQPDPRTEPVPFKSLGISVCFLNGFFILQKKCDQLDPSYIVQHVVAGGRVGI